MSTKPSATGRPRILLLTDRVPGRTAGNEFRVANVIEGLLAVGDVQVCFLDSSVEGASFPADERYERSIVGAAELPRWLRILESIWTIPHLRYGNEEALCKKIVNSVDLTGWDIVWFSRARVHRLCSPLFDGAHILDLDDLNNRLLTTLAADRRRQLGVLRSLPRGLVDRLSERRWRRRYQALETEVDRLVVCHQGDVENLGTANAVVVPNGYPTIEGAPSTPPDSDTILFVGPISYEPNYLAVRWFVDEVFDRVRAQLPDATLSVVGSRRDDSQSIDHPGVTLHGWVPDVTPYYDQASMTIAPLHSGGGTRIKILETMARHRAMVATEFAVEGLGLNSRSGVLIADEPQAFADHCVQLLTHADFAAEQAATAHTTFCQSLGADRSITAVTKLATAVLAERTANEETAAW